LFHHNKTALSLKNKKTKERKREINNKKTKEKIIFNHEIIISKIQKTCPHQTSFISLYSLPHSRHTRPFCVFIAFSLPEFQKNTIYKDSKGLE
jgi:hypothetical protein